MTLYPSTRMLDRDEYDLIARLAAGASSALEFGPGATTWALIEARVQTIHTYEYLKAWADRARLDFAHHETVRVGAFANEPEVVVSPDALAWYDIAIVDSPKGDRHREPLAGQESMSRLNTALFACSRAKMTLMHDAKRPREMETLKYLADRGFAWEIYDSRRGVARIWRQD